MRHTFLKKIFLLFMMLVTSLILKAQAIGDMDEDGLESATKRPVDEEEAMDGILDYQPIHFDFQDVILVLLLLFACYVFGKIWKGCSYLLIILAALFFFFMR